jgi:hypothetical protein
MNKCMLNYDFIVMLESINIQYSAPGDCQVRMPHLMSGVIITSKYKMLTVLSYCCEKLGKKKNPISPVTNSLTDSLQQNQSQSASICVEPIWST